MSSSLEITQTDSWGIVARSSSDDAASPETYNAELVLSDIEVCIESIVAGEVSSIDSCSPQRFKLQPFIAAVTENEHVDAVIQHILSLPAIGLPPVFGVVFAYTLEDPSNGEIASKFFETAPGFEGAGEAICDNVLHGAFGAPSSNLVVAVVIRCYPSHATQWQMRMSRNTSGIRGDIIRCCSALLARAKREVESSDESSSAILDSVPNKSISIAARVFHFDSGIPPPVRRKSRLDRPNHFSREMGVEPMGKPSSPRDTVEHVGNAPRLSRNRKLAQKLGFILQDVTSDDLFALRSLASPPRAVVDVVRAVRLLICGPAKGPLPGALWSVARQCLSTKDLFMRLVFFDPESVPPRSVVEARHLVENYSVDSMKSICPTAGVLLEWLQTVLLPAGTCATHEDAGSHKDRRKSETASYEDSAGGCLVLKTTGTAVPLLPPIVSHSRTNEKALLPATTTLKKEKTKVKPTLSKSLGKDLDGDDWEVATKPRLKPQRTGTILLEGSEVNLESADALEHLSIEKLSQLASKVRARRLAREGDLKRLFGQMADQVDEAQAVAEASREDTYAMEVKLGYHGDAGPLPDEEAESSQKQLDRSRTEKMKRFKAGGRGVSFASAARKGTRRLDSSVSVKSSGKPGLSRAGSAAGQDADDASDDSDSVPPIITFVAKDKIKASATQMLGGGTTAPVSNILHPIGVMGAHSARAQAKVMRRADRLTRAANTHLDGSSAQRKDGRLDKRQGTVALAAATAVARLGRMKTTTLGSQSGSSQKKDKAILRGATQQL